MRYRIQKLICAVFFFISFSIYADSNQGYSYLLNYQQSDGSVVSDPSLTHPLSSTVESILVFDANESIPTLDRANAINFIKNINDLSIDNIAQALKVGINYNQQGIGLLEKLITYQNTDGGFGSFVGYDSTVLDTAIAIEAFILSEYSDSVVYQNAINFIIDNQLPDGSFRLDLVNNSSVFITAKVLTSLKYFMFKYPIASQLEEARDFLIEELANNNQLTTWERASALNAIVPMTSDTSIYANIVSLLSEQQLDNGSWENSVYITALVLQALYLVENTTQPIEPTAGVMSGKVIDASSKLPLASVNITLDSSENVITSDSEGRFEANGISPNSYSVSYLLDGYLKAQQAVTVVAGQIINLGEVELTPVSDKGIISGIIIDAETKAVVLGALVSISGSNNLSIISDASGAYHISLEPGEVSISISAEGYYSVSGTTEILAGNHLKFSPSLTKEGSTPPDNNVTVKGRVLDENTGQPLLDVSIKDLNSAQEVFSDVNGEFALENLVVGELLIEVSKVQYQTVTYKILSMDGSPFELGDINLKASTILDTSTLFGSVVDSETGIPISGAKVSIDAFGLSAITGAQGQYELSNIPTLSFELSVSGVGYVSQSSDVTLPKHQRNQINMQLTSSQVNGFVIANVSTDKNTYNAYQKIKVDASFVNASSNTQNVELMMIVRNSTNSIVASFPAVHSPIDGEITDSLLTINSNTSLNTSFEWMNGNISPDNYQLTLVARDLNTRQLLSEKAVNLKIEPDSVISSMVISALPRFTNVEATENIKFAASVINKSNVSTSTSFSYRWLDPSGNIIVENTEIITTLPSDVEKSLDLNNISHQFLTSGEYTLEIDVINGITPENIVTRSVFVAPLVRVEPLLSIEPNKVIPDGDKKIKVKLQLKGSN